jgi:hypothetical protein
VNAPRTKEKKEVKEWDEGLREVGQSKGMWEKRMEEVKVKNG